MRKSLYVQVIAIVVEFLQEFNLLPVIQKFLLENGKVVDNTTALAWAAQVIADNKNAVIRILGFDPEEYEENILKQRAEDYYWALKNDRELVSNQNLVQYNNLLKKLSSKSIDKDIAFLFRNFQYERGESFSSFKDSDEESNSGFEIGYLTEDSQKDESHYGDLKYSELHAKVLPLIRQRRIEVYHSSVITEELSYDIKYEIRKVYDHLLLEYLNAKEDGNYSLVEDILLPQIEAVEYSYPFVLEEYNRYE